MLSIQKYKRYWAVYQNDELLTVTVYKRGAKAVVEALRSK